MRSAGPVAQRKSNCLLNRRTRVRIPPGPILIRGVWEAAASDTLIPADRLLFRRFALGENPEGPSNRDKGFRRAFAFLWAAYCSAHELERSLPHGVVVAPRTCRPPRRAAGRDRRRAGRRRAADARRRRLAWRAHAARAELAAAADIRRGAALVRRRPALAHLSSSSGNAEADRSMASARSSSGWQAAGAESGAGLAERVDLERATVLLLVSSSVSRATGRRSSRCRSSSA